MKVGSFRFLEEIALADCAVDVTGATLDDLFDTAALALTEMMVDPATVPIAITRRISLEASGLDLLLFDWLSDMIFRKDRDAEVFVRTAARVRGTGPYHLEARLEGGAIVPGRTIRRADAKGVTFYELVVEPTPGGWHARFVVDL
jgi:SHS2 domain-containing protein